MHTPGLPVRRLLAFTACAALALGVAACGDSEDDDSGVAQRSATATETAGGETTAETAAKPKRPAKPKPSTGAEQLDGTTSVDDGETTPPPSQDREKVRRDDRADLPIGTDTPEEKRVAAIVRRMYGSFAAGDAAAVCAVMSNAAREGIAQSAGGEGTAEGATCEQSFSMFVEAAKGTGTLQRTRKTRVRGVAIDGGVATVTVALGGRAGTVRLIQEDGEWRFDAAPVAPR